MSSKGGLSGTQATAPPQPAKVTVPQGALPSDAMHANRRPRASRAFLALVFCLALLGPGATARATGGAVASTSLTAGPAAWPEQGLLRDLSGPSLVVAPGGKRDNRERPGPALLGLAAAAVAAAWTVVAGRPAGGRGGHGAAAVGARAPPPPQPRPV
jgi:hypothetical protein